MFRNDNPEECRNGGGYPRSTMRDDPTEEDYQEIFGAQWLVRYLMGKQDGSAFEGYIPRRNVPRGILYNSDATDNWEQAHWYEKAYWTDQSMEAADPVGLYMSPQASLAKPVDLVGYSSVAASGDSIYDPDEATMQQHVFVDYFGYPILYYSANTAVYQRFKSEARIAGYKDVPTADPEDNPIGIYTHADNGIFTGLLGDDPEFMEWPFSVIKLKEEVTVAEFGDWAGDLPSGDPTEFALPDNKYTFPHYILNRTVFDSTKTADDGTGAVVTPYHPDSFLLTSPGQDGVFGSPDDITNFEY